MKKFKVYVKEKSGKVLHPEYYGDDNTTREFIESFYGLKNDDVEEYSIEEVLISVGDDKG